MNEDKEAIDKMKVAYDQADLRSIRNDLQTIAELMSMIGSAVERLEESLDQGQLAKLKSEDSNGQDWRTLV